MKELIEREIKILTDQRDKLRQTPRRTQYHNHDERIANLTGQIQGLKKALLLSIPTEPNLIEQ